MSISAGQPSKQHAHQRSKDRACILSERRLGRNGDHSQRMSTRAPLPLIIRGRSNTSIGQSMARVEHSRQPHTQSVISSGVAISDQRHVGSPLRSVHPIPLVDAAKVARLRRCRLAHSIYRENCPMLNRSAAATPTRALWQSSQNFFTERRVSEQ